MPKQIRTYAFLILIGGLLAACETADIGRSVGESTTYVANPYSPVTSKQYLREAFLDYGVETLDEGDSTW
ncbi:MAG: hypothetical protein PVF33_09715, partial [Candidatus Latescibacterota bacterium]